MRACLLSELGHAPAIVDVPQPVPGPGQVLIAVAAAGLNFADLLMIAGRYQQAPPLPFVLGMEMAGTVLALGPGVTRPAVGTRVACVPGHGALAARAVVAAAHCLPLPDSIADIAAAGFQIAYGTAHLALATRARLAAGETLVVLGAAGGVGLTAVEVGAALGARVIAVVRGADKAALARAAGATEVLETDDDLKPALRALGGADVLFDPVGGAAALAAQAALRPLGRHLVIGFASGDVPDLRANHLLVRNIDVMGFWWGGYRSFAPDILMDSLRTLLDWHAAGRLRPHVTCLPLDRVADGFAALRDRRAQGKIVVTL